ncbi:MAG: M48 family metallopeptidase [Patescibacteria group bacterium]|nr:M48 family metallopeptidase [Patescibacteria group bacterium]
MATLYTHADSNIRKTWILLFLFLILIIGLGWFFSYYYENNLFLIIAIVLSLSQGVASFWFSDKIVLSMTGAKEIQKKDNPELYRIVENLAITAGLPMPKLYIINSAQPNAFATGRDYDHAVVAVTRGLLEKLERAELEGVIAHELAHIGNKDMLLGTVVVVLVGIVALLSRMFLRISFYSGGSRRKRGKDSSAGVIMVLGVIGAILAPIIAILIQLSISRKREFLADASGALLTRYPEGLARALEKISSDKTPLRTADSSTAHLYISSPFKEKNWLTGLFSTHPPVEKRLKALRGMKV